MKRLRFGTWLRWALLGGVAAVLAAGCLTTGGSSDRPFSEDWAHGQKKRLEFKRRQERINGGEIVLMGDKDKAHAGIKMDEKGRPQLGLGKDNGLSADVDVGSKTDVKFKYKWGWK